jgi:hypothetical protein
MRMVVVMLVYLSAALPCLANTINVRADGTGDYPTIQAAINAASSGDEVVVQPGTYTGYGNINIDFMGKAITVRGATDDPNDCIIDCQSTFNTTGFKFISGEAESSVLKNVTITNGKGVKEYTSWPSYWIVGGGIYCVGGSPTITNCIFKNNTVGFNGGGIYSKNGDPVITDSIFISNSADYGGGIYNNNGNIRINNCSFLNNSGNGICITSSNDSTITNCFISGNTTIDKGAGIDGYNSTLKINNCIITYNTSESDGAGMHLQDCNATLTNCVINSNQAYDPEIYSQNSGGIDIYNGNVSITNCTICGNSSESGGGAITGWFCSLYISNSIIRGNLRDYLPTQFVFADCNVNINYSNIQGGYTGAGNIDADPIFKGDGYHLSANSPCLDTGDPNYTGEPNETDIDGDPRVYTRVDIGADELSSFDLSGVILSTNQFSFTSGGKQGGIQTASLYLRTYNHQTLNWNINGPNDCNWLSLAPLSGQTTDGNSVVTISIDPSKADYGISITQFTIITPDTNKSPQTVTVSLAVSEPFLSLYPSNLFFYAARNTLNEVSFNVVNRGYDILYWHIEAPADGNGIKAIEPMSGECAAGESKTVKITIDTNGLNDGWYKIFIPVKSGERQSYTLLLSMYVYAPPGEIHVPRDYNTIQAAISAASAGNIIIVHPGKYAGFDVNNPAITIRSVEPENPAVVAATIIESKSTVSGYQTAINGLSFIYNPSISSQSGDGIDIYANSDTHINNCRITNFYGRGIYSSGGSLSINNCIVSNNGYSGTSGGIVLINGEGRIENCIITNNFGRGISVNMGDIYCPCILSVINSVIANNYLYPAMTAGRGITINYSSIMTDVVLKNSIVSNKIGPNDFEITIANSTVSDNIEIAYSDIRGGPSAILSNQPGVNILWGEGDIDVDPCFASIVNWLDNNTPGDTNDDVCIGGDYHLKSASGRWEWNKLMDMDAQGDGFWDTQDFAILAGEWQKTSAKQSLAGRTPYYLYLRADLDRSGRVDLGDLIIFCENYLNHYDMGQWVYDDVNSACIDAGDPNSDWTKEIWPHGKRINMGAYGGTPEASMSPSTIGNIADIDNSGMVDDNDLKLLIQQWLENGIFIRADLDLNLGVNFIDFSIFAENWAWQEQE